MSTYRRFVAMGDSQTEGLWDGDDDSGVVGWTDRFAETLADHTWADALDEQPAVSRVGVIGREIEWAGAFFGPWHYRRLRGRSTGRGRTAKRPALTPVRTESDSAVR